MSLRSSMLRIASGLPQGDSTRRKLLAALKAGAAPDTAGNHPEVKKFLGDMKKAFSRHFPQGYYAARAGSSLGDNAIYIATATLPKGQQANGYLENDPSYNTFWMHGSFNEEGLMPRLRIELSQGGKLYEPNFTNGQKIGWRTGTAKPASIVKKFDAYFGKLARMVALQKG